MPKKRQISQKAETKEAKFTKVEVTKAEALASLVIAIKKNKKPASLARRLEFLNVEDIPDLNSFRDENGDSLIHISIKSTKKSGLNNSLEELVAIGLDLDLLDGSGKSALHNATAVGSEPTIQLLLSKGADINQKDSQENTPLHDAVKKGHVDTVDFLIKSCADINAINHQGDTPLHKACKLGRQSLSLKFVQVFTKNEADLGITNKEGCRPFDIAYQNNYGAVQKKLKKKDHFDLLDEDQFDEFIEYSTIQIVSLGEEPTYENYLDSLSASFFEKQSGILEEDPESIYLAKKDVLGWIDNIYDENQKLKAALPVVVSPEDEQVLDIGTGSSLPCFVQKRTFLQMRTHKTRPPFVKANEQYPAVGVVASYKFWKAKIPAEQFNELLSKGDTLASGCPDGEPFLITKAQVKKLLRLQKVKVTAETLASVPELLSGEDFKTLVTPKK